MTEAKLETLEKHSEWKIRHRPVKGSDTSCTGDAFSEADHKDSIQILALYHPC